MDLGSLHAPHGSIHSVPKDALGERVALAIRASAGESSAVWSGPKATSAERMDNTHILVRFAVSDGAGGLSLGSNESCPATMLKYYCTGESFEVQGSDGLWEPIISATEGVDGRSIILAIAAKPVERVRYAYADWPVATVRNRIGGLPARIFDMPVVGHRVEAFKLPLGALRPPEVGGEHARQQ